MIRQLVVAVSAALVLAGGALGASDVRVVEEIVAKVNGEIITKGDLDEGRHDLENEAREQGLSGAQLTRFVNEAVPNLLRDKIDQLLLVQRGEELEIKVDPEVTRWIAGIQFRSGISDPEKFAAFVLETYGVPLEDLKKREHDKLMSERIIGGEVQSRIFISEADMQKYYNEHHDKFMRQEEVYLSQILISTEHKTPEQVANAERKAKELVARLRQGEKFSDLAVVNSDDTATSKEGGYIGSFKRSDLLPAIADQVFAQKKGYITDPIKLDNPAGFLILKVEDSHEAGQATFDEVRDEIQSFLASPQMEGKIRDFLTTLRQNAFLEIRAGYVDTAPAPGKDTTWREAAELKPETTTKAEVAARQYKKAFGIIPYGRVGPAKAGQGDQGSQAGTAAAAKTGGAASSSPDEGTPSAEAIPLRKRKLIGLLPMGAPIQMPRKPSAEQAPDPSSAPEAAPAPAPPPGK